MKYTRIAITCTEIVIAIIILLSVLSHSPNDPSPFHSTASTDIINIFGAPGAWIADALIQSVGTTISAMICIFIACRNHHISRDLSLYGSTIRISLFLLFIPFAATSISILCNKNEAVAGFLGYVLSEELFYHIEYNSMSKIITLSTLFSVTALLGFCAFRLNKILSALYKYATIATQHKSANTRHISQQEDDFAAQYERDMEHASQDIYNVTSKESNKNSATHKTIQSMSPETSEQTKHPNKISGIINKITNKSSQNNKLSDQHSNNKRAKKRRTPSISIIDQYGHSQNSTSNTQLSQDELHAVAKKLLKVLQDFGINGKIQHINQGPVVTLYELEPVSGTKSSRVIGLSEDIARSMMALTARINVVAGKNALGIELPNEKREIFSLYPAFQHNDYINTRNAIPIVLGKSVAGDIVIADLAKMPHLLIAGTTGSGKSVAINAMILSLLYKFTADECKIIMIDPKMLELSVYEGIPHLITPVVTDPKKALPVLKWLTQEMEERYRAMAVLGVRNISAYNSHIENAIKAGESLKKSMQIGFDAKSNQPIFEEIDMSERKLPYIVLVVEEMADLILVAGKDIESYIQRLAQMARAAGIHLIMATQRPSVDVITGVIKANFPTRISFQVTSKIDSRTILGEPGAEQLLGMGDMLYMKAGGQIERVHGPLVTSEEILQTVHFLKSQSSAEYTISSHDLDNLSASEDKGEKKTASAHNNDHDELYEEAVQIILRDQKVSTSYIQRRLKIGYNRASLIIEQMEDDGIISSASATGKRHILIKSDESS